MTMDLRELYQEIIMDHNNHPRNHHAMADASATAKGFNRMCGDKLTVYLKLEGGRIVDVSFEGSGCAISQASASLMTEALVGQSVEDAEALYQHMHRLLTTEDSDVSGLNKLSVLAGVKAYPARVKCASLAWHTMDAALHQAPQTVSTE